MISSVNRLRQALMGGASVAVALTVASPSFAETAPTSDVQTVDVQDNSAHVVTTEARPISERQSYALRLMTQIYDGTRDVSETQLLGVGRVREGDRSFSQLDYGDGAIVIAPDKGKIAAGRFLNLTETEKGVVYDYASQRMYGDPEIANFHNRVVRPLLNRAPPLGRDVTWSSTLSVSALGMAGISGTQVPIELSRQYFTHDGKPMVLIHYAIPAFVYDTASGRSVVQWGEGISLTDPGFGMIYINSALHRAVARENGSAGVPYRLSRTMVAANPDGSAMIDYREVVPLQPYIEGLFGKEAMMVVPTGEIAPVGSSPLDLMRNLDIIALSIGENSANEAPTGAAAQTAQNTGSTTFGSDAVGTAIIATGGRQGTADGDPSDAVTVDGVVLSTANVATKTASVAPGVAGATSAGNVDELAIKVVRWVDDGYNAARRTVVAEAKMQEAQRRFLAATSEPDALVVKLRPQAQSWRDQAVKHRTNANRQLSQIQTLEQEIKSLEQQLKANPESPGARQMLEAYRSKLTNLDVEFRANVKNAVQANDNFQDLIRSGEVTYEWSQKVQRLEAEFKVASEAAAKPVADFAGRSIEISTQIKKLPPTAYEQFIEVLDNSKAGKFALGTLDELGHALNQLTVGQSVMNTGLALINDQSTGDLNLTRSYVSLDGQAGMDDLGGVATLGLDMLSLAGNAFSGNVKGAISDSFAITFGSVGDVVVALKGLKDVNRLKYEAAGAMHEKELERLIARIDEFESTLTDINRDLSAIATDLDMLDAEFEQELEASKKRSEDMLRERREAREELARQQAEQERLQREENARQEQVRQEQEAENERRRTANERLNEDMEPDYPTAPPRDAEDTQKNKRTDAEMPGPTILTDAEIEEIKREQRRAEAQAALDEYQAEKIAQQKAEQEAKNKRRADGDTRTSTLETSQILTSAFDLDPVTSDPVVFDPVTSDPVTFDEDNDLFDEDGNLKFDIPVSEPPDPSRFPPTDPDDLDGYPGTGEYPAATYDSMSGQEPDLARWEDWLATQDVRKLEQLARAAGYPSLAFALADAENIIRDALDTGFRSYVNRGPNCAGTTGCTGSVGPWRLAYARVRLGDILAQSRDVFSTGGFSDVAISNFNLMYALRDFGIQDGDLIDVEISQYGRTIFEERNFFLLNAPTDFDVRLRPGVAQMVITALNEGSASPNTAEVSIENVVRGEGLQTYSLDTGQTAVLRIEAGASGD